MKKLTGIVILAVIMVIGVHSFALATKVERKEYNKIMVEKGEVLVYLTECHIAKLDMEENYLALQLSELKALSDPKISYPGREEHINRAERMIKKIQQQLQDLQKSRKELQEALTEAKQLLEQAKSLPE